MEVFNLPESFGTQVTLSFKNFVNQTGVGYEQRIGQWYRPLLKFSASKDVATQDELDYLLYFHSFVKGQFNTFLYKDKSDFVARQKFFKSTSNYAILAPYNGSSTEYTLMKVYSLDGYNQVFREIRYPKLDTLKVYDDNTEVSFTYNPTTFTITLLTPPIGSPNFTCEFFVPCRFEADSIEYTLIGIEDDCKFYKVSNLSIVEVREDFTDILPVPIDIRLSLPLLLDFPLVFDSVNIPSYESNVEINDSGYEQRKLRRNYRLLKYLPGSNSISNDDLFYIINLFRCCIGNLTSFQFSDITGYDNSPFDVRFEDESLSYNMDYESSCGIYYTLNNTSFVEVINLDTTANINEYSSELTTELKYKLYYGFTSANGANHSQVKILYATFNGLTFVGNPGSPVPKKYNVHAAPDSNDTVILVPDDNFTTGSCFVSNPITQYQDLETFNLFFHADLGNGCDGLAFVIHGQFTGDSAIGILSPNGITSINALDGFDINSLGNIEGKALGYMGISPSFVVEFDNYNNENDSGGGGFSNNSVVNFSGSLNNYFYPNENHIGVSLNGSIVSNVAAYIPSENLFSGVKYYWIDYATQTLRIYGSSNNSKPGSPFLTVNNLVIGDFIGAYKKSVSSSLPPVDNGVNELGLCYCWKIVRKDGFTIGLTNHDLMISFDGVNYNPNGGFSSSAIQKNLDISVNNSELKSFFVNSGINESDILYGLYDDATVFLYLVDWTNHSIVALIQEGLIGEISHSERIYNFECRSQIQKLLEKRSKLLSSSCPLIFGETGPNKCNKPLGDVQDTYTVTSVTDSRIFAVSSGRPNGYFAFGTITWLSGQNTAVVCDVFTFESSTFTLWEGLHRPVTIGDTFLAIAGCNKSLDACISFSNVVNFGGDPFVPGADALISGALTYSSTLE